MAYIPFGVRFMAHCTNSVYGHSGADRKVFFFFFFSCFVGCVYVDIDNDVTFSFFVRCVYRAMYVFHIHQHAQLSSRSGLGNMMA